MYLCYNSWSVRTSPDLKSQDLFEFVLNEMYTYIYNNQMIHPNYE
jgi:hypothetical protein